MSKPLKDWTVGELMALYDCGPCEMCPFEGVGCGGELRPRHWNLVYAESRCRRADAVDMMQHLAAAFGIEAEEVFPSQNETPGITNDKPSGVVTFGV